MGNCGIGRADREDQFAAVLRTAFADIYVTLDDAIAEGDKVGWRYTFQGTHKGELLGIPPTGKVVTITGSVISRFAGGKWAEDCASHLGLRENDRDAHARCPTP
jgi:predicted ester cyclase